MDPSLCLSRRFCPGTRPFCCLPTTHPTRLPREQERSLPSPTHWLTLLRLDTRSWGRGRSPKRGRRRWGLAWRGQAGWQAGSWLGRWCLLRPQAAWAWSGGGGRGGAEAARLYLATLLIPKQQALPFLSLQLLDPDKYKAPSVAPQFKVSGPWFPGKDGGGAALRHPSHLP